MIDAASNPHPNPNSHPDPDPNSNPNPARPNENNVYDAAQPATSSGDVHFLGIKQNPSACQAACNTTAACLSWTWCLARV
jgi:hypothetical protein